MTDLKEQLYQMFILGCSNSPEFEKALKNGLGGVIFFTKDITSALQFKNLTKKIKTIAKIPPFLSIDQEGGRVERTENIHGGKKYLSAKYAYQKGLEFLQRQTEEICAELNSYGINLNFAPCIDTNTNPNNPIINERSFSSNPDEVAKAGLIVSEIYRKNGIIPCAKHYPGHGDTNADSHLTLPVTNLPLGEMKKIHLKPFEILAKNNIEMIMAAHIYCTCFDNDQTPASLSKNALSYLRNELNYKGIVISDDMEMKAIQTDDTAKTCIKGIKAGLNMFIFRYCDEKTINTIEKIYSHAVEDEELQKNIQTSYSKIKELKRKYIM